MNGVIDADTHISECDEMWKMMEREMQPRRPVLLKVPEDTWFGNRDAFWLIDGNIYPKPAGKGSFNLMTPSAAKVQLSRKDSSIPSRDLTDISASLADFPPQRVDYYEKCSRNWEFPRNQANKSIEVGLRLTCTKPDSSEGNSKKCLSSSSASFKLPLFWRRVVDPFILDVLILGCDAENLERFTSGTFKPVLKASRNQYPFVLFEFTNQLVALSIEFHSAGHDKPEGVIARMGMKIVFASIFHDLDHDLH